MFQPRPWRLVLPALLLHTLGGCIAPPGTFPEPSPTPTPTPRPTPFVSAFAAGAPDTVTTISTQGLGLATDLTLDAAGNLYLASDHQILKLRPDSTLSTLVGSEAGDSDGPARYARLASPWGLAFDSRGNLFVADSANHRIRKILPDGTVSTYSGSRAGYADGPVLTARFFNPKGLAIDAQDNLYVSEGSTNSYHIRKISPSGSVTTLAGGAEGQVDGQGAQAAFLRPEGLDVDANGVVYVVDSGNQRIRKILPDGTVTTFVGSDQGYADGQGLQARFDGPADLAIDPRNGYLYVSEFAGNRIRQITPGGYVTTLLKSSGAQDGPLASASLSGPLGLCLGDGVLFFLDSLNHSLRKISL